MDREDLRKAMLQAQEMQIGLLKAQEELSAIEIEGKSRNGLVTVVMTAQGETVGVDVKDELLSMKKEVVEKSILEAVQAATDNASVLTQEKLSAISNELGLEQ